MQQTKKKKRQRTLRKCRQRTQATFLSEKIGGDDTARSERDGGKRKGEGREQQERGMREV
jgi:hypothetical protein